MNLDLLNNISLDIDYSLCPPSTDKLFLADISGNDSIAALIRSIEVYSPDFIIPTVVTLGCEFGNKNQSKQTTGDLLKIYKDTNTYILPGIFLDINYFWKAFIADSINNTIDQYKFFSPCISCHLIMHLARIQLSLHLNINNIISGERELHSSKEKINQLGFVLDFYNEIFEATNIKHHTPIRFIKENDEIDAIANNAGVESIKLNCLFSGTYYNNIGQIAFDKDIISDYVKNHLLHLVESFRKHVVIKCRIID